MPWVFGDDRLKRGHIESLMPLRLRVIPRQRLLAIGTLLRLECAYHVNVFHWH
jgi:hypothetical protein